MISKIGTSGKPSFGNTGQVMLVDIPESSFLAVLRQFERWYEHIVNEVVLIILQITCIIAFFSNMAKFLCVLLFPKIGNYFQ